MLSAIMTRKIIEANVAFASENGLIPKYLPKFRSTHLLPIGAPSTNKFVGLRRRISMVHP
jgi:hypothetical protein